MLRYDEIIKITKDMEGFYTEHDSNEKMRIYAKFIFLDLEKRVKDRIKEKNERKNKKWFKFFK